MVSAGVRLAALIHDELRAWHERHGTPEPQRTHDVLAAWWILELMAVDGHSQRDAREKIGCTRPDMARHLAVLVEVFPPFEEWLQAHTRRLQAGDRMGSLPMMADSRTSRRRLRAPADGRWNDLPDSQGVDDDDRPERPDRRPVRAGHRAA